MVEIRVRTFVVLRQVLKSRISCLDWPERPWGSSDHQAPGWAAGDRPSHLVGALLTRWAGHIGSRPTPVVQVLPVLQISIGLEYPIIIRPSSSRFTHMMD
jgi:hypothetical protein